MNDLIRAFSPIEVGYTSKTLNFFALKLKKKNENIYELFLYLLKLLSFSFTFLLKTWKIRYSLYSSPLNFRRKIIGEVEVKKIP